MKKLCLGLFPNMMIEKVKETLPAILQECAADGIAVRLAPDLARTYGTETLTEKDPAIDVAVSLGGDGTFLRMARSMVEQDIPVFGINFGHLGFLAEVDADCAGTALQALSRGHLKEERRHLLQLRVIGTDGRQKENTFLAINEFVASRDNLSTINHFAMWINHKPSGNYAADGLIISTATGSTAYSLSAGGPLVEPGLDVMIITPIASHNLSTRPLVIPASELVQIQLLQENRADVVLSSDGIRLCHLSQGERAEVTRSPKTLRLIRLTDRDYYETWQEKLVRNL